MDSDSDDLYDPSDSVPIGGQYKPENAEAKMEDVDEGEEEGEGCGDGLGGPEQRWILHRDVLLRDRLRWKGKV